MNHLIVGITPGNPKTMQVLRAELAELVDEFTPVAGDLCRHAEFRGENGEFWVIDVGSLNGTYVNRQPVRSAVLASGDEIHIGKFRLVFLTGPTTG